MCRSGITADNFFNPPEKVRLIFQAVTDLLADNADISTIKVQEITSRAGIGKGTAYEYFSSREEIIVMALLYDYGKRINELQMLMNQESGFRDKIFCIFDWIYKYREYHMNFVHLMRISSGRENISESIRERIPAEIYEGMTGFILSQGDKLLEQGYQEGVFMEKDPVRRRLAFVTMLIQVFLSLKEEPANVIFQLDYELTQNYAYDTLVRLLS